MAQKPKLFNGNEVGELVDAYTKAEVDTKLNGKSPRGHTHTKAEVTDFPTNVSEFTNDSNYQNESQVKALITALVNSAPETLDTLKELADALGNDPNFATTITNLIGTKAPLNHTHAATQVTQDATHRFVTDTEKSTWNGKVEPSQLGTQVTYSLSGTTLTITTK